MKLWKVDNYCIGPAVDADYDNTAETLEDVLNTYEKQGAKIQQIILESKGNYQIIYTVEDMKGTYGI